jgi:hypothetical protein
MKAIPIYSFSKFRDDELITKSRHIETSMTGNTRFPDATERVARLKTANDEYETALIDAKEGGKMKVSLKDQKRKALEKVLKELALYVQLNCKDDVPTLLSSGFDARSDGESPVDPGAPENFTVEAGRSSGSIIASCDPFKRAKMYIFEYALASVNGDEPEWKVLFGKRKKVITGLTPGKEYMFRSAIKGSSDNLIYSDVIYRFVA